MATTSMSDFGQAFQMLEASNWNLEEAISLHFSMMDTPDPPASDSHGFKLPEEPQSTTERPTSGSKKRSRHEQTGDHSETTANTSTSKHQKSSSKLETSLNSILPQFSISVKNKHNNEIFKKAYKLDTLIEKVRLDACQQLKIPIELAVWNLPEGLVDTDTLTKFQKKVNTENFDLEIENLLASMDGNNDHQIQHSDRVVEIEDDVDESSQDEDMASTRDVKSRNEQAMEISSDDDEIKVVGENLTARTTRSQSRAPVFNSIPRRPGLRNRVNDGIFEIKDLHQPASSAKKTESKDSNMPHKGLIPKNYWSVLRGD